MLFNSLEYFLFFAAVAVLYYLLPLKLRMVLLLVSSLAFYAFWNINHVFILIFISLSSYFAGILIANSSEIQTAKKYLIANIIICLLILIAFKYLNFLLSIFFGVYNFYTSGTENLILNILIPVGISYFTFRAISYTVDVYWGKVIAEYNIINYGVYLCYFPTLFAGPIDRASNILLQLKNKISLNEENLTIGFQRILWGLFKKLVIAERLAIYNDYIFQNYQDLGGIPLILGSILWVFQLYCDFSAYTDIAIGSSKLLGINLIENFDRPFISKSITELWRRWHMSMSFWFRDYIYTPLSVSKRNWGKYSVIFSITVTFLLVGLWHGASWNWVVFGLLQGVALSYEFLTSNYVKRTTNKVPLWIMNKVNIILTFAYFTLSCIFFKILSVAGAMEYIRNIFNFGGDQFDLKITEAFVGLYGPYEMIVGILSIVFMLFIESKFGRYIGKVLYNDKPIYLRWGFYYLLIFGIVMLGDFSQREFIYMGF